MVEALTGFFESLMGTPWIYPLVALLVFIDSVVPAFPAEVSLNLAGAWSGARGVPRLSTLIWVTCAAALVGDSLCFLLGKRLMPQLNRVRRGTKAHRALMWIKRNMRRGAGPTLIIARFIPSARFFVNILLGSMRYPWGLFLLFDTAAVLLWALQALLTGYAGGALFSDNPLLGLIAGVAMAFVVGALIQKAQNRFWDWRDASRGYAETP